MIKIENVEVCGWKAAIRGLRNPMNSWDKSDTVFCGEFTPEIGNNDLDLMMRMNKGGSCESKYRRMITVTMDVVAPLYWWKEFDTYKVGTVANSCSTMHKIQAKEFTIDDFSHEHLAEDSLGVMKIVIKALNDARDVFVNFEKYEKDVVPELADKKDVWWQMIQLLPTSYNQRRTIQLNYEVLSQIHYWRKNHKLDEWHTFCDWIETLPYANELIIKKS